MATIRFFKSSSIDFIDLYYYNKMQSDETRLYYDIDYPYIDNDCYFIKKDKSRPLIFQFRTDYENFTVYRINSVNGVRTELDVSSYITEIIELEEGLGKQYKFSQDVEFTNSGYYCFRVDFEDSEKPIANFQSQWFELQDSYENCLLIECNQGQYGTNNDGIIWDEDNEYMWIESQIANYVTGGEQSTFRSSNGKLITSKFTPIKSKVWECELMPDIVLEKINLWRGKSFFWINEVQYNSEEIPESERQGDTRLYPLAYQLEVVKDALGYAYEDYTFDNEIQGDLPPESSGAGLKISDTGILKINNNGYLKIN